MAVGRADPAVGHPPDQVLERDVDVAGEVDPPARLGQRRVERLGLDLRAREPVEDRATDAVGRLETVEEDPHDRVVGHELAAAHVPVGLATEGAPLGDGGTQQIARGKHRDAKSCRERRRLCPLPCPRSAQQDDDGHWAANLATSLGVTG